MEERLRSAPVTSTAAGAAAAAMAGWLEKLILRGAAELGCAGEAQRSGRAKPPEARMVGLCCADAAALRLTVTGTCEPPGVRGEASP